MSGGGRPAAFVGDWTPQHQLLRDALYGRAVRPVAPVIESLPNDRIQGVYALLFRRPASAAEVAAALGLSGKAARADVADLVRRGLVRRLGIMRSGPGRAGVWGAMHREGGYV